MKFSPFAKQVEKWAADNSPAILTALGVTGSLAAAFLTGKASFQAVDVIREEQRRIDIKAAAGNDNYDYDLTAKDKARLVWKLYIPPAITFSLATAAVIGANRVGNRRAAAMATAYGLSERAYAEYKEKVVQTLGEKREREVRDEIAQDRVRKNPPREEIVLASEGDQLCMEHLTNRYFYSSMEELKQAENIINNQIIKHNYASLSMFYDILGLPHTSISDDVGWSSALEMLELRTTATIGYYKGVEQAIIVFDYNLEPIRNYDTSY